MSLPGITNKKWVTVRTLTPEECDLLEFESPLQLAQRYQRFVVGPWRPVDEYEVVHRRHGRMMICTRAELARLGVEV